MSGLISHLESKITATILTSMEGHVQQPKETANSSGMAAANELLSQGEIERVGGQSGVVSLFNTFAF